MAGLYACSPCCSHCPPPALPFGPPTGLLWTGGGWRLHLAASQGHPACWPRVWLEGLTAGRAAPLLSRKGGERRLAVAPWTGKGPFLLGWAREGPQGRVLCRPRSGGVSSPPVAMQGQPLQSPKRWGIQTGLSGEGDFPLGSTLTDIKASCIVKQQQSTEAGLFFLPAGSSTARNSTKLN